MSFNIDVRKKQLHSLKQYINSTKDKVDSILNYLGWTAKAVLEAPEKVVCPIDKKHSLVLDKVNEHVKKCSVISSGYKLEEQFLSEPREPTAYSISLDNAKKIEILNEARQLNPKFKSAWNGIDSDPMTSDRLFSTFSTDERLALYEYCRLNARRPPIPKEFTSIIDINKKEEHELTEEEKLIRERNAKRRRVKYKSVHTGRNKSHTEVLREVIRNQMEMYGDYLTEKRKAEEEAALKREAEARSYEQFPHVDTRVVYDYGIDPFETIDNFEDAFNVNYDYRSDLGPKIENERSECKNVVEDENKPEKKCNYRRSRSRERDRRARSRDGRRRRSRIRSREDQRVRSRHERRH